MHYVFLFCAIVTEVIGTAALQGSQQFTRTGPSVLVVASYSASFYFLSLTLKSLPLGLVYATWSGLGIVLIGTVGWVVFGQKLDLPALLGMGMIICGVIIIYLFSSTITH
ncbi:DMT family transporter [Tropicimonas sp. S265A]|uniref:DMT family transporter n=1 Tax=Tropicimonas sp. S265A TaxID=3415134 RepID=UPI003C79854E